MPKEPPVDIVFDDQMKCTYVPRQTRAAKIAAAELKDAQEFYDRWTVKGGIQPESESDDDDDIGVRFRDDGRYLANENRDVVRLMDRARRLYSNMPDAPDMPTGRKIVLLDRARRVAFGYVKPAPKSLAQGLDGGVDVTVYQQRRVRPGEDDPLSFRKTPPTRTIVPRHRADMRTACIGVLPNRFSAPRVTRAAAIARRVTASQAAGVTKRGSTGKANADDKNARLRRRLASTFVRNPVPKRED